MSKSLKFILKNCIYEYIYPWLTLSFCAFFWSYNAKTVPDIVKKLTDSLNNNDCVGIYFSLKYFFFFGLLYLFFMRLYDYIWLFLRIKIKYTVMQELYYFSITNRIKNFNTTYHLIKEAMKEIPSFLNLIFNNFIAYVVILTFAAREFYLLNSYILFAFIFLMCCFITGVFIVIKFGRELTERSVESKVNAFNHLLNVGSNFFYVQFYRKFDLEKKEFDSKASVMQKNDANRDYMYFILHLTETFLCFVYEFFCLYILVQEYLAGNISVGMIAKIYMFNKTVLRSIWDMASDVTKFIKFYQLTFNVLDKIFAEEDALLIEDVKIDNFNIEFKNVCFKHSANSSFKIENFNLSINQNDKIAFTGASGNGKTTIINLLLNIYNPNEGEVLIGGINVNKINLSKYISIINQDLVLFNRSIFENIAYGSLNATLEDVQKITKLLNIHDLIMEKGGYDVIITEHSANLSQGQKQRILIARMLLADTPIIVLDEATSALDKDNEKIINDYLLNVKNKTILLITHRTDILNHEQFKEIKI